MAVAQALLYLLGVTLLVLAGFGVIPGRVALLGAASALLAYSLPAIVAGFR